MDTLHANLKDIILNVQVPYVIKDLKVPWPCFEQTFEDWCAQFDSTRAAENPNQREIEFETASRKHSNSPQWEKFRAKRKMTVQDFYENSLNETGIFASSWAAFSYKNICEMPSQCVNGIDFAFFGFPEVRNDITFWLSSTDAHTPCHYDTYGCNIVVQVYGKKSWMLFPPDAKLTATRIPYEESSVYCCETFFSPKDGSAFKDLEKYCHNYILHPGDVLIVPPKWWHYVENLCPSLSVNAWIPIKQDAESQIQECIVKILMKNFMSYQESDDFANIVNPNELQEWNENYNFFEILEYLVNEKRSDTSNSKHRHSYMSPQTLDLLLLKFKNQIIPVPKLTQGEFNDALKQRFKRFDPLTSDDSKVTGVNNLKRNLINSVCNPDIVNRIADDFLLKMSKN